MEAALHQTPEVQAQDRNNYADFSIYCALFALLPVVGLVTAPVGLTFALIAVKRRHIDGLRRAAIAGLVLNSFFTLLWSGMLAAVIWSDLTSRDAQRTTTRSTSR
jgi:hypothetical protein